MRPRSIVMFERLFLASLVLSVIAFVLSYDADVAKLERMLGVAMLGLGSTIWTGAFVLGLAIYLLLWLLIARKASNVAKWFLIVFVAIGLISFAAQLAGPWDLVFILSVAIYVAQVSALICLFQDDAAGWLKGGANADAAPSD